jgi:hypothetical protein
MRYNNILETGHTPLVKLNRRARLQVPGLRQVRLPEPVAV